MARLLYKIITHPEVHDRSVPILIAFNKIDLPTARNKNHMTDILMDEMYLGEYYLY